MDSDHLAGFLKALKGDDTLDLHSLMILRHGAVVAEADFGAYDRRSWGSPADSRSISASDVGAVLRRDRRREFGLGKSASDRYNIL